MIFWWLTEASEILSLLFKLSIWMLQCHHFSMANNNFHPKKLISPDASPIRWVVETANRRIKQFKYFANTIQNSSLGYLESDLSIACALINRYQPPIATSKPEDGEVDQKIMKLLQQKYKVQLVNNCNHNFSTTCFMSLFRFSKKTIFTMGDN